MNKFARSERVSELIHREISVIIDQELRDSRIGMVTVTSVDMSKDLKNAKVYVSVLGDEDEIKLTVSILNSASNFIRVKVGERAVLKYLPTITFFYDSSTVDGMYMDKLIDEIKNKS
ncbi:30S ribosome-binding factor RbfA [Candidatus Latescibacterota bacterium]